MAEGKAPCYGCVSGGSRVAAKVCEIMGAKVPQEAVAQFGPSLGSYRPRLGIGRGVSRGLGEGRGIDPGRGRGRGFGRRRRGR